MKKDPFRSWISLVLVFCGALLIVILFVPMWQIDLDAPQYPEGLSLLIFANKLAGNVDIINGLNHYIGMKTMHSEDFIEFTILPYLISGFALLFFLTAIMRNRKFLHVLFISFLCFGIIAMVDFWKWEYNYGHNLNPEAAIVVPGMAYQPPLIGFKQLLNFGAYSSPDTGGWIFIGVGFLLLCCVVMDYKRKDKQQLNSSSVLLLLGSLFLLTSCQAKMEPIQMGKDHCMFCKMTLTDVRYGVEVITHKGKLFIFDEIHCFVSAEKKDLIQSEDIKEIYFTDYAGKHQLIRSEACFYLRSPELKSPMGGHMAAFSSQDSLRKYRIAMQGQEIKLHEFE